MSLSTDVAELRVKEPIYGEEPSVTSFKVELDQEVPWPVKVDWAFVQEGLNSAATYGTAADYTFNNHENGNTNTSDEGITFNPTNKTGTITFQPNQPTKTVKLSINGDRVVEDREFVHVALFYNTEPNAAAKNVREAKLDKEAHTLQIAIDDTPLTAKLISQRTISVVAALSSVREPSATDPPVYAKFDVTLDEGSTDEVTVDWQLSGTATHGTNTDTNADYTFNPHENGNTNTSDEGITFNPTNKTGTITFQPNQTTKTITLTIKPDTDNTETDETITLTLTNPNNALLNTRRADITILESNGGSDPEPPTVYVTAERDLVREPAPGTPQKRVKFKITLQDQHTNDVQVNWRLYGSATKGLDYNIVKENGDNGCVSPDPAIPGAPNTTTKGSVTFQPGETRTKTVCIDILPDIVPDDGENIIIEIHPSPDNTDEVYINNGTETIIIADKVTGTLHLV